ncbi:winged helix-turn-helix domain-containing protein [Salipiger bermudensis]|uniref:winged helix-turn-helix transcriptional regulator n=1 Tax=Salipiger bermudensis TaxID=344736 RepID=UPI001C997590|nr:winged helix-turn-helix domain-containing protein [Salipiger bermudensis]MBY6002525.1 winged helix-turn-helix domain-containing protein [Salipiger bermudensis]
MRYLIGETNWKMVSLSKAVAESGLLLTRCEAGEELADFHSMGQHDLLVLDAALLGRDVSLADLRALRPDIPICLVAASPAPERIASWLMAGADVVMEDSTPLPEMLARLAAVARRAHGIAHPLVERGPLLLDLERRRAHLGDVTLSLSPKLYEILEFLALRPGRLAAREALLGHVYGFENEPAPRVFDVYMCNLRSHLGSVGAALKIETVRGSGYRLEVSERRKEARPLAA